VTSRLGVAVVGTGRIGSIHARVLSQMPNVDFVGVVDSDDSAPRRVAAERGGRAFAASRSGAVFMVGHGERFNPVVTAVREHGLRPRFRDATHVLPFLTPPWMSVSYSTS